MELMGTWKGLAVTEEIALNMVLDDVLCSPFCWPGVIKSLLEAGADLNRPDNTSNWPEEKGLGPMHIVAKQGWLEIIDLFLEYGADINIESRSRKFTPLAWAISAGQGASVELLINRGANINCECHRDTPLMLAVIERNMKIVKLLIDAGADINYNAAGGTALLDCIAYFDGQEESWELLKFLIDHQADINQIVRREYAWHPNNGMALACEYETPLMKAVRTENYKLCQYLLGLGADALIKYEDGHSAIELAKEKKNKRIIKLLNKFI